MYPLRNAAFTLIELLVVMVVAGLLLAGFTAFYLSQQRNLRHHQIEVETSQSLRTALEQVTRDLRSARRDVTRDFNVSPPTGGLAAAAFLAATATTVEFQLDFDDDGVVTTTEPREHKGFRRNAGTSQIEQLDPSDGSWPPLADYVSNLTFTYWGCPTVPGGALVPLTPPVTGANLAQIVQVDVSITVNRPVIGGLPVNRTEAESVRLRNVRCS